jgi:hypothetical protein
MTSIEVEDGEVDDAKTSAPATTTAKTGPTPSTSSDIKPAATTPAPTMESRKSDILDRREQIKRENAAKAAAYAAVPPRPDSSRNSSILDRASPNLPSRPDAPFPSRLDLDRHSSRHLDELQTEALALAPTVNASDLTLLPDGQLTQPVRILRDLSMVLERLMVVDYPVRCHHQEQLLLLLLQTVDRL